MLRQLLEALGVISTQTISPPSSARDSKSAGDTPAEYQQADTVPTPSKRGDQCSAPYIASHGHSIPSSTFPDNRCRQCQSPTSRQDSPATPTTLHLGSSESRSHASKQTPSSSYYSDPTLNECKVTLDASGTQASLLDKEASDSEFDAPSPISALPRCFKDDKKGWDDKKDAECEEEAGATVGGRQSDLQGTVMMDGILNPGFLFDVTGMVVVITGGGTGIGLMMATALENNGAIVYIIGRRQDVLERAVKEKSKYGNIIPLQGDITSKDDLLAIVEQVKKRSGYIDLLINNAGIARNLYPHPLPSPGRSQCSASTITNFQAVLWETGTTDDFAETFQTNVTAIYYATVAFLELLDLGNIRRRKTDDNNRSSFPHLTSQVLSVSSSGSFRIDPKVLSPSYTLAKAACTHLGRMLANLLAPWGIRSNVLAPGVWPSEMTTTSIGPDKTLDPATLAACVPLKRVGTQEDIAGTILFLASRAAAYVNGAVWLVDGGRVGSVASSGYPS